MKKNYYEDLTNQPKTKISQYFDYHSTGGNALLIFDHGMGDLIMFLPLLQAVINKYPKWDITIGYHPTLAFENVHPNVKPITELNKFFTLPLGRSIVQDSNTFARYDMVKLSKKYKYIFAIQYRDYNHPLMPQSNVPNALHKTDMCKVLEFGLPESFQLVPYVIPFDKDDSYKGKVAFHMDGHTDKKNKCPDLSDQELIWNEIKEAGYDPIDIHINSKVSIADSIKSIPPWMEPEKTLRNSTAAGLKDLLTIIGNVDWFIGIVSGPMCIANNILAPEKSIIVEGIFKADNYQFNKGYHTVNINPYIPGTIKNILLKRG